MKIKKSIILLIIFSSYFFLGWGRTGHQIINRSSTYSFNDEINFMVSWADFLAAHGSDADDRKGSDPTEGHKHYIDIDAFPEFTSAGSINQNFDSLVAQHGLSFVEDQGVLPWAILNTYESLKTAFENEDWENAKLLASDLGHYVGDAHMPLHLTLNYNGYSTNQGGIHSRYESTMLNSYASQLQYNGDSLIYIEDQSDYVFQFIYSNYVYVDSVLAADLEAKSIAGSYNSTYYQEMWNRTKDFTKMLFKSASNKLANLIYSAWINAGSPILTNVDNSDKPANSFLLKQNYPNPFNPSTKIEFRSQKSEFTTLKVFDILCSEVRTLVSKLLPAGTHTFNFNGGDLPSGIYFYKIQAGAFSQTRKMILLK